MPRESFRRSPLEERLAALPAINGGARYHPTIGNALEILEQRAQECDFRLTDLAGAVAATPAHLSQTFRATTGLTFQDYRAVVRVRCALELIARNPYRSITRIALEAGFGSLRGCEIRFRQLAGVAPREFQSAVRAWIRMDDGA